MNAAFTKACLDVCIPEVSFEHECKILTTYLHIEYANLRFAGFLLL